MSKRHRDTVVYHDSRTLQETVAGNCTPAAVTDVHCQASYLISLLRHEDRRLTTTQHHFYTHTHRQTHTHTRTHTHTHTHTQRQHAAATQHLRQQNIALTLSSHAGTVEPECFKDDNASQWKSGKFDPRSLKNPRTDRHLNLHG